MGRQHDSHALVSTVPDRYETITGAVMRRYAEPERPGVSPADPPIGKVVRTKPFWNRCHDRNRPIEVDRPSERFGSTRLEALV